MANFFAIYPAIAGGGGGGGSGTVTSVDVSGGVTGLTTSGGPVTTSGTITVAGLLNVGHGGTNSSAALANNKAMVSTAGAIVESTTTTTELGYINNVTSDIQAQLNGKQASGNYITALTGDVTATGPGSVAATIANLAVTNAKIANATIDLTTKVTGVLPVANGGTNSSTGSLVDNVFEFVNSSDATKQLNFDLSGESTGITTTISPLLTANTALHIRPLVDTTGNIIVQNGTSGQVFIGADSSIGGANSGFQYSDATTANRGQIRLGSYVNATSIAGVTTATSRSGTVGVNAAVVAGQDYSKWTAQAGATTPGSLPISGAFAFKANTVNSLSVTSDFHLQLTNLAGTIGDRLYLSSEGLLQLPGYSTGIMHSDASGNLTSSAVALASADVSGALGIVNGGTGQTTANPAFNALSPLTTKGDLIGFSTVNARLPVGTDGQTLIADSTQTLGIKWAASSANLTANIRANALSTVVLTNADQRIQIFDQSTSVDVKLPTTGVLQGDIWQIGNRTPGFEIVVQGSDGSTLQSLDYGTTSFVALINTPVTGADWAFIGPTRIYGDVSGTATLPNYVGEYRSAAGASTSAGTSGTYQTLATLALGAGIWDVNGIVFVNGGSVITEIASAISLTAGTADIGTGEAQAIANYTTGVISNNSSIATPIRRLYLTSGTGVYLVGFSVFATAPTYTTDSFVRATRVA